MLPFNELAYIIVDNDVFSYYRFTVATRNTTKGRPNFRFPGARNIGDYTWYVIHELHRKFEHNPDKLTVTCKFTNFATNKLGEIKENLIK